MSAAIPNSFSTVVAAVESVCAEFESRGEFRLAAPDKWVRALEVEWAKLVDNVAFLLDVEAPLLAIYVVLRVAADSATRSSVADAVNRVNFGLLPGCFEFDADTGETRYRSVLPLLTMNIEPSHVAQLLSDALTVAKAYGSALQAVATGADPAEALAAVES